MHVVFVDTNSVGKNALVAAKRAGHDVSFVCSRAYSDLIGDLASISGEAFTNRIVELESSNDQDDLFETLSKLHHDHPIDALMTVLDFCTLPVAHCAERLGLAGTKPAAVRLAQDKGRCRDTLESLGCSPVPHRRVEELDAARLAAETLGYPIMAKPNRGGASILASKIRNELELETYFDSLSRAPDVVKGIQDVISRDIILEKYIEGPLFSLEVAAAVGECVPLILSARKRCLDDPSIELGTTMPAPVKPGTATALTDCAMKAAQYLELDFGIFHIEMILGPDGPVLVEVNPRIMGGNMPVVFKLATGIDVYDLLIDMHLQRRLPAWCSDISAKRAASTRMIGALEAGNVKSLLDPNWTAPFIRHVENWNFEAIADMHLATMETSFCPYSFQVVRDSPVETSLLAEWIVSMTSNAIGIDMRRSGEDYLLI